MYRGLPVVVAFGGGLDSTAMLIGLVEKESPIVPDLILFADTGGERPTTYAHVEAFSRWLTEHGLPEVVTVQATFEGAPDTLEAHCARNATLPSIAFGVNKSCSIRYKRDPQDRYVKQWGPAQDAWAAGEKVWKLIGYDIDDYGRYMRNQESDWQDPLYAYKYPLIDWEWTRRDAAEAVARAGLAPVPKSACFFCPSSRKSEIVGLRDAHPDLAARAVAMEERARLTEIKGLGRRFAWCDLYTLDDQQLALFPDMRPVLQECMCYEGDPDETPPTP